MSILHLINLSQIRESKTNPRSKETPEQLAELVASIKTKGLIQPITVRPFPEDEQTVYEIISGHRRFWAYQILGNECIEAILKEVTQDEMIEYQIIENVQRKDLHPLMECEAYIQLAVIDSGLDWEKIPTAILLKTTIKNIAEKVGKSEAYVAERLQLTNLIKESREWFSKNVITLDHALELAKLTEEKQKEALGYLIESFGKSDYIAKDIKEFKHWIDYQINMELSKAPWDKEDGELIPGMPACTLCPKNSSYNTALFPEINSKSICNDRTCFNAKMQAYFKQQKTISKKEKKIDFILLSENYGLSVDDPMYVKGAVKMKGRYIEVKPGKECENTKRGQYIDGPKKGKFVLVCNYSKCAKHWKQERQSGSKSDDYNSPENIAKRAEEERKLKEKIKTEREYRYEVMTAVLEKCHKKLSLDVFRNVVRACQINDSTYDLIARRHGWEHPSIDEYSNMGYMAKENFCKGIHKKIQQYINDASEEQLMELYYELTYSEVMDCTSPYDLKNTSSIEEAAKLFKLNLKNIRLKFDTAQEKKQEGEQKELPAEKKQSKKKAKK